MGTNKPDLFDVPNSSSVHRVGTPTTIRILREELDPEFVECEGVAKDANVQHAGGRLWKSGPSRESNRRDRVPKEIILLIRKV